MSASSPDGPDAFGLDRGVGVPVREALTACFRRTQFGVEVVGGCGHGVRVETGRGQGHERGRERLVEPVDVRVGLCPENQPYGKEQSNDIMETTSAQHIQRRLGRVLRYGGGIAELIKYTPEFINLV